MPCIFLNIWKMRHVRFVESSNILLCCYIGFWLFLFELISFQYSVYALESVQKDFIRCYSPSSHWNLKYRRLTELIEGRSIFFSCWVFQTFNVWRNTQTCIRLFCILTILVSLSIFVFDMIIGVRCYCYSTFIESLSHCEWNIYI